MVPVGMEANLLLAHPLYNDLPISITKDVARLPSLPGRQPAGALQKHKECFEFVALLRYT
jgi:hypothetical protein